MNVFDRITKSPQALADFLQAIPAVNAPWDDAFHRIYCDQCAAEMLRDNFFAKLGQNF